MRLDLTARTTYALLFGMLGLLVMLIGSMLGQPVNGTLAGIFGSIVLAAIGVETLRSSRDGAGDRRDGKAPSADQSPPSGPTDHEHDEV